MSADVANKATGAAESNAASPPVTAKDESNQPSSSLNEGTLKAAVATPQPPLKDDGSAVEGRDEKDPASAAAEAASSKASTVAGSTLSQAAGKRGFCRSRVGAFLVSLICSLSFTTRDSLPSFHCSIAPSFPLSLCPRIIF